MRFSMYTSWLEESSHTRVWRVHSLFIQYRFLIFLSTVTSTVNKAMASSAYTCISCRVAFANADLQRAHYKSDWHRYNLKRKLAEMVPVTAEEFKQRVLDKQAQVKESQQDSATTCKVCSKRFSTANAFTNHMQSKKHKEVEARITRQVEAEVCILMDSEQSEVYSHRAWAVEGPCC